MGITSITERFSGDAAQGDSPDALHYSLDAERVLDILVNDPTNWNTFLIGAALADPALRNVYPSDFWLRCDQVRITRSSPISFECRAHYHTPANFLGGPLAMPPIVEFDDYGEEDELDFDVNGNAIATVNGELFDPPVREPSYTRLVTVTRNVAMYNDVWASQFRNAVNSNPWKGYDAGTVRCISLKGRSVLDSDFIYWVVTGAFAIRAAAAGSTSDKAWYRRIAAMGLYVMRGGVLKRGLIDQTGADVSDNWTLVPVPHDTSTGAQLALGASIQYYEFQTRPSVDLNQIGLI